MLHGSLVSDIQDSWKLHCPLIIQTTGNLLGNNAGMLPPPRMSLTTLQMTRAAFGLEKLTQIQSPSLLAQILWIWMRMRLRCFRKPEHASQIQGMLPHMESLRKPHTIHIVTFDSCCLICTAALSEKEKFFSTTTHT